MLFSSLVVMALLEGALPTAARAEVSNDDKKLAFPVLVGAGMSWTNQPQRLQRSVYPAALLEVDLGLGRHGAFGLYGDYTYVPKGIEGFGVSVPRRRFITGFDIKLLPNGKGSLRPWVMVALGLSLADDYGAGYGVGVGTYLLRREASTVFLDLREYLIYDMEGEAFQQASLRAGLAF